MTKIVIASGNQGKINDFKAIFKDFEVTGIKELLPEFDVDETGTTFRENAILKSESAMKALNLPVISDDSGLSVEALEGRPGVYSARYSGEGATDEKNNAKLLEELKDVDNRAAYFTCVLALSIPGEETLTYEGTLAGEILREARGSGGFGYDPLFKTLKGIYLGEITSEEKGEISHRGKALEKLMNDTEVLNKLKK